MTNPPPSPPPGEERNICYTDYSKLNYEYEEILPFSSDPILKSTTIDFLKNM